MVSDEQVPHVKHLYRYRNIRQFKKDLDFFLSGYEPVALNDLLQHLKGKYSLPKRCLLLTFDDGFREMHDIVAPILKAKGVPATFFLSTGFIDNLDMAHHCKLSLLVEHITRFSNPHLIERLEHFLVKNGVSGGTLESRMVSIRYPKRHLATEIADLCGYAFKRYLAEHQPYLTSDQIRSLLKQGFSVGAHSIDHPLYADLKLEEQTRQTIESMRILVDNFGLGYRAFAFPHSDAGVNEEFFADMKDNREIEASFGTGGMRRHFFPSHLERFSMENSSQAASQIVKMNYLRAFRFRRSSRNA